MHVRLHRGLSSLLPRVGQKEDLRPCASLSLNSHLVSLKTQETGRLRASCQDLPPSQPDTQFHPKPSGKPPTSSEPPYSHLSAAAGPLAGKAAERVNKHTEHLAPSLALVGRAHPSSPNTEPAVKAQGPGAAAPLPLPRSHELAWDPASPCP